MYFSEYCPQAQTHFGYDIKSRVEVLQSAYQTIEIFETTAHGYLMVIDGCTMVTTRDNYFYHEVMGLAPLAAHPHAQNVLIIGGGDCGTLRETLNFSSVQSSTQVDIDKKVTDAALKYFPELTEKNDDQRASIHFDDGINWINQANEGSYDVIIVDSTDPVGPGEGLFNQQFHDRCYKALGDEGVLIQQSESPLFQRSILEGIRENFKKAGFKEIVTLVFPQPCYPSGFWSATLASKKPINWKRAYEHLKNAEGTRKFLSPVMLESLVLQSSCWPSAHVF